MSAITAAGDTVFVTVELFGMARVHANVGSIAIEVGSQTPIAALLEVVAQECPALLGNALCQSDNGTVTVADGYALNRNGLVFLPPEVDAPVDWAAGDSLLLLSNQAGG